MFELQMLRRETYRAQRVEVTSEVDGEPTSKSCAAPLEVISYLFVLCKRTFFQATL
jgi:hypothetical protein